MSKKLLPELDKILLQSCILKKNLKSLFLGISFN
jgi:hypothetical protein